MGIMMKYVTSSDIQQYLADRKIIQPTHDQLANMANWFAEGAVTSISNHIYKHIVEGDGESLQHNIARGCRCLGCCEWQIVDDDGRVLDSAETLSVWAVR